MSNSVATVFFDRVSRRCETQLQVWYAEIQGCADVIDCSTVLYTRALIEWFLTRLEVLRQNSNQRILMKGNHPRNLKGRTCLRRELKGIRSYRFD